MKPEEDCLPALRSRKLGHELGSEFSKGQSKVGNTDQGCVIQSVCQIKGNILFPAVHEEHDFVI